MFQTVCLLKSACDENNVPLVSPLSSSIRAVEVASCTSFAMSGERKLHTQEPRSLRLYDGVARISHGHSHNLCINLMEMKTKGNSAVISFHLACDNNGWIGRSCHPDLKPFGYLKKTDFCFAMAKFYPFRTNDWGSIHKWLAPEIEIRCCILINIITTRPWVLILMVIMRWEWSK